ncbi:hypothetical protein [Thermotomaculum hydrothermale]|nr:hypothetical protein [Thermotomaculum hydrothermale]
MKKFLSLGLVLVLLVMIGCAAANHLESNESQPLEKFTTAIFDPAAGIIPFPNDLLIDPVTGKNAIPNPDGLDLIDAVNSLSGFSTVAPISFFLDGAPDTSTLNSNNIKFIDVTAESPDFGSEIPFSVLGFDSASGAVSLTPIWPLKPHHKYVVVVTKGVKDSNGKSIEPDKVFYLLERENALVDANGHSTTALLDDATAQQLEYLRQAMKPIFDFLTQVGITRDDIAIAFTFTTQGTYDDFLVLKSQLNEMPAPAPIFAAKYLGDAMVAAFYGAVEAQTGIDFPHDAVGGVLTGAFMSPNFISNPLAGHFEKGEDGKFVKFGDNAVPFILVVPKGTGPFPVVIFQHGFTRTKMDALAIANTFASIGVATISMDLVLHGDRAGDFMNNETGELVPDGQLDPSGALFMNLAYLRTARDNIRQSNLDQMMLVKMLQTGIDYTDDNVPDLLPMGFTYAGQSLGGMTGTNLMALEPNIKTAVLNVPGGNIAALLTNSPAFAPVINEKLAENGIVAGTPQYNQFWLMAQTVIDAADPINYAPYVLSGELSGTTKYVLMHEAIGDQVVPNISGDALARAFGSAFPQIEPVVNSIFGMTTSPAGVASGLYQYNINDHGFLLDNEHPEFTYAGQMQTAMYIGSFLQSGTPVIIDPFASGKSISIPEALKNAAAESATTNFNPVVDVNHAIFVK